MSASVETGTLVLSFTEWESVMDQIIHAATRHIPWNKGKLVGQKAPLKLKEIWAIRIRMQLGNRTRELALLDLAIDSKLRSCDLVKLRVRDVCHGNVVAARAIVMQQKTQRPVQFEITEQTRESLLAWIRAAGLRPGRWQSRRRLRSIEPPGSRVVPKVGRHPAKSGQSQRQTVLNVPTTPRTTPGLVPQAELSPKLPARLGRGRLGGIRLPSDRRVRVNNQDIASPCCFPWSGVLKAQAAHEVDPYPVIAQRELVIRKHFRGFRQVRRKLLEIRSYARLWHTENTADQGRVATYSNRIYFDELWNAPKAIRFRAVNKKRISPCSLIVF
jgi:hypothetical protein